MKKRTKEMGVLVHTCHDRKTEIRYIDKLDYARKYYTDDPKFVSFKPLPEKCDCKRFVSDDKRDELLMKGTALLVYMPKEGHSLNEDRVDWSQIVMVVNRTQTPRVDLITKADMERAYVDCRPEYIKHIEEIHDMIMAERAKLIVPFRDDPDVMFDKHGTMLSGRILFPFGPDQRT